MSVKLWTDVVKMLAIGFIMLAAVICSRNALTRLPDSCVGRVLVIAVPAALGCAVYFGLAFLFKLPETAMALGIIKKRFGR
jgi:hypothetical protein